MRTGPLIRHCSQRERRTGLGLAGLAALVSRGAQPAGLEAVGGGGCGQGHLKDSAGLHLDDPVDEWGPVLPHGGLESSIMAITSTGRKGNTFHWRGAGLKRKILKPLFWFFFSVFLLKGLGWWKKTPICSLIGPWVENKDVNILGVKSGGHVFTYLWTLLSPQSALTAVPAACVSLLSSSWGWGLVPPSPNPPGMQYSGW